MLHGSGGFGEHRAVLAAREHAREVEAEAVDAQLVGPVLEAVHDEARDQRMVAVDRVAAAGVVAIAARVARVVVVEDVVRRAP